MVIFAKNCCTIITMKTLKTFLKAKGYVKIPLILTETNHLEILACINNIEGRFILDTGASSTCVDLESISFFNLEAEVSEIKAAGAGATNMDTQLAKKNTLSIGNWETKKVKLVLFDLTHVNTALTEHNALPVHGIIGADILKKGKAIIDYSNKTLYLKKK